MRKYFSLEVCQRDCATPDKTCIRILRDGYSYCQLARPRIMLEEWVCDRCHRKLGLSDGRHVICVPPEEELMHGPGYLARAYARMINVCDECFGEGDKILERFGFF